MLFSMFAQLTHLHLSSSADVCLIIICPQGKLKTGGEDCKEPENEVKDILGLTVITHKGAFNMALSLIP